MTDIFRVVFVHLLHSPPRTHRRVLRDSERWGGVVSGAWFVGEEGFLAGLRFVRLLASEGEAGGGAPSNSLLWLVLSRTGHGEEFFVADVAELKGYLRPLPKLAWKGVRRAWAMRDGGHRKGAAILADSFVGLAGLIQRFGVRHGVGSGEGGCLVGGGGG